MIRWQVMTSSMRLAHQPAIRAEANRGVNTSSGMPSMVYTRPEDMSTLAHMGVSLWRRSCTRGMPSSSTFCSRAKSSA